MLNKEECHAIHVRNAGRLAWLDNLATNDGRLVLTNADEILHVFMSAEWDETEQAQAARLCAAINHQRRHFGGEGGEIGSTTNSGAGSATEKISGEQPRQKL